MGINRSAIWKAQGRRCFYCHKDIPDPLKEPMISTRDHLLPRALGFGATHNTVIACRECNCRKGCCLPTRKQVVKAIRIYASLQYPIPYAELMEKLVA